MELCKEGRYMDDLVCRIGVCINELDDIADDLHYIHNMDSTELNKIADLLSKFQGELRKVLE